MNKKAMITFIQKACNLSIQEEGVSISGKNDLLVLITAAGQITGTPIGQPSTSKNKSFIPDALFQSIGETYSEKFSDDNFILLKDATLKTSVGNIFYSHLYVFTDDVIAVTATNTDVK